MKRNKFVVVLVIGAFLVAPTQTAAQPDGVDRARAGEVDIVPLVAVEEVTRTARDATGDLRTTTEKNRLYRDAAGRTRHESATTVTINDPTTRTTLQLDKASHTYTRAVAPTSPSTVEQPAKEETIASAPRPLGTAVVSGVRAEGSEYTLTKDRDGKAPLTKDVTVWLAEDIQLDVSMRVTEPSGEEYAKTYTDIRTGVTPKADLFTVPTGYRTAAAPTSAAVDCPVDISPDPLVLVSYGLLVLGSGTQRGSTDFPNAGCLIADTVAVVQNPLWAAPATPYLGLPYFDWFFYDNGDPFVPCNSIWFGSAGFLAYSTEDTSDKWSVVALYVYC